MKAWSVMDRENECGCIVFAETRGKARAAAMGCAGLDLSEWNEVEVLRLPDLDGKRDAPCVLDWEKDGRIYYEAGWWVEGAPSCDCCGLYQYDEIPESRVTETTDEGCLCAACLAEARPTGAWLTLAFLSSP